MNDEIRRLRSEAHHLARGKAPRAIRYPAAFRDTATAVTRTQLSQGMAVSRRVAAARVVSVPSGVTTMGVQSRRAGLRWMN